MIAKASHTIESPAHRLRTMRGGFGVDSYAPHGARPLVSFPFLLMGQYFKAVNLDKQEVVCPWCMSGGAKLWEWAANPQGAVFTLLLRQSSESGGGDYYGYRTQEIHVDSSTADNLHRSMLDALHSVGRMEGRPVKAPKDSIVGRWAGDRILLVGDYDASGLFDASAEFRNVTRELVEAWNEFIDLPDRKLTYRPDCSCA